MTVPPKETRWQCPKGRTGVFTYSRDARFSYCLYVPESDPRTPPSSAVVVIHDSLRNFMECRDAFADFAERHRQVVLAPLFPINVLGDGNPDGYKYLLEEGIRYDMVLNGMVEAVAEQTGCDASRICLWGYSGGGHLAHRYLFLHPDRVLAASIGAPGEVTLLDPEVDWWAGVRDIEAVFGKPLDLAALRRVPLQLVVGDQDTQTDELDPAPASRYWQSEAERCHANRIDRLRRLQRSLEDAGVTVQFELMRGIEHSAGPAPAMALAKRFFAQHV